MLIAIIRTIMDFWFKRSAAAAREAAPRPGGSPKGTDARLASPGHRPSPAYSAMDGAAPQRTLAPQISDTPDTLKTWQVQCWAEINLAYNESHRKGTLLHQLIQALPLESGPGALEELTRLATIACGPGSDKEAADIAAQALGPKGNRVEGLGRTNVYVWRYDDESLWTGIAPNQKLVKITKSILTTGFWETEPISARTNDLSLHVADDGVQTGVVTNRLLFGDGCVRGMALRWAWALFTKFALQTGAPRTADLKTTFLGLLSIPTVFASHGSFGDALVAQAVQQNIRATMTQPLNSFQWAHIAILAAVSARAGTTIEECLDMARGIQRNGILTGSLNSILGKYHKDKHVLAAADVEPVAKRQRRGRRRSGAGAAADGDAKEADQDDNLKIGAARLRAIQNILENCTSKSYELLKTHLGTVGQWKDSALHDLTLGLKFLWPGSMPPQERLPTLADIATRDAGAKASQLLVPAGLKTTTLFYESPLTEEEHEAVLTKAFHIFEDEATFVGSSETRAHLRPTNEPPRK